MMILKAKIDKMITQKNNTKNLPKNVSFIVEVVLLFEYSAFVFVNSAFSTISAHF